LICRLASPDDRRLKVLDLTPAGARLRAVVLERMTKPPETLKRLSREEQRMLVKILQHLLKREE
jgi:DNA-binding MarR family transcriptional regulator